jgi:ABC-type dipeptide/oligopeptide/nickel transport system ATPase component
MAKNSRIRHVLVTGPTGSGKSVLAKFLLNERGIKDPPIVNAGELDKDGLDKWWRQSGLYIDHLVRMNPSAHDPVCRELEKALENPDGEQRLCVWSANSIQDLQKSEILSDSFISLIQRHSLVIDKLRIEDVQEITGEVRDQYAPEFQIATHVYKALEETEWPDNLRGLQGAVKEAINRARELGDSELRVDHLQLPNLKTATNGQAVPGPTQAPPELLQHEIAAGMTPSVPDMNPVDDWTFRQQKVDAVKKELKKLKTVIDGKGGNMLVNGPEFISSRQAAYPALAQCDQDFVGQAISYFKDRNWGRSLKDLAVYVFTANECTRFEDYEEKYGPKELQPNHGTAQRGKRVAIQPSPGGSLRRIAAKRGM